MFDPFPDPRSLEHGGDRILRLHGDDGRDILGRADVYPRADGAGAFIRSTRRDLHRASGVELGGLEPVRGALALGGELREVPRVLLR